MMTPTAQADMVLETLVAAFEADPLYRWLYPDPAARPMALRANLQLTLDRANDVGAIDTNVTNSAVAFWTEPGVELLDDPAPFVELLDHWSPTRRDDALAGMMACSEFAASTDQILHVVAVHPDQQNGGVGAGLLAPRLQQLDRDGVCAYLESSNERNLGFYRRCGFELLGEVPLSDGGPVMRPMRRQPRQLDQTLSHGPS